MRRRLAGLLVIALGFIAVPARAAPLRPHDRAAVVVGFVVGAPTVRVEPNGAVVAVPVLTGRRQTWAVTGIAAHLFIAEQTVKTHLSRIERSLP